MQKVVDKSKCHGCHACYNICPVNCISMEADKEGFLYPVVDKSKCVKCGRCRTVCPALTDYVGSEKGQAFACVNRDDNIRLQSSSGGVFTLIAEYVLSFNGVVFGAAFDDDFSVKHIEISSKDELSELRGSKYIQSTIGATYKSIKMYLEQGKMVLFSGTPCQISGLRSYLGKDYNNLIVTDIICHGVPSPMVWRKYLEYREKIACDSTRRTNFRHKKYGWNSYSVQFKFSNCTEYEQIFSKDLFMQGFLANLCLRPTCYNCHSKSLNRQSDITLADFWGIKNILPEFDDDKGTSLVLINSPKGKWLFDAISGGMIFKEVDIDEAVKYNTAAYKSVPCPKSRRKFLRLVREIDFDKALEKSLKMSISSRIILKIKRFIKGVLNYVQK